MLEKALYKPGFTVEGFCRQAEGGSGVLVSLGFANWRRGWSDAMDSDALDQGTALNDRGTRGRFEDLKRALIHVR